MIENCDNEDYLIISDDRSLPHCERETESKEKSELISQYKHQFPKSYEIFIAEFKNGMRNPKERLISKELALKCAHG